MRRSSWVLTIGAGGIILLLVPRSYEKVTGAPPKRIAIYANAAQCVASDHLADDCATAYRQAEEDYESVASRYPTAAACKQASSAVNCTEVLTGDEGVLYRPPMDGFVLGTTIGAAQSLPVYYDSTGIVRVIGIDMNLGTRCGPQSNDACQTGANGSASHGGGGGGGYGGAKEYSSNLAEPEDEIPVERGGFGLNFDSWHFGG